MSFAFDAQRTRAAVEELAGALDPSQRVPVYAFPFLISSFDLRPDHDACARGFRTILRLPFRKDVSRGTIAEHLRATISARLLLFLADTTSLEVSGTPNDFRAEIERHSKGDCTEILIRSAGEPERWLVFNRALQDLDRALVDPIGEAWKRVEQVHVALAVRLDDSGLPCIGRPEPAFPSPRMAMVMR